MKRLEVRDYLPEDPEGGPGSSVIYPPGRPQHLLVQRPMTVQLRQPIEWTELGTTA